MAVGWANGWTVPTLGNDTELTSVQLGPPSGDPNNAGTWGGFIRARTSGGDIADGRGNADRTNPYRNPFAGYYRGIAMGRPHTRWGGGFGLDGTIDVDGAGAARSTRYTGEFVGDFYGPSSTVTGPEETAGWWRIAGDAAPGTGGSGDDDYNDRAIGVVGSFGAKRQ